MPLDYSPRHGELLMISHLGAGKTRDSRGIYMDRGRYFVINSYVRDNHLGVVLKEIDQNTIDSLCALEDVSDVTNIEKAIRVAVLNYENESRAKFTISIK